MASEPRLPSPSNNEPPTPTEALRLAGYGKLADRFPASQHASLIADIEKDAADMERFFWEAMEDA